MKNLSKQMHKHIISVCVIRNLKYLYLETRVFVKIFWDKWTWVGGGVVDPTWQEKTRQGRWIQTATALMVWLTSSYNHKGKSKVQTEHKTQINTSPRNKTKTKGNPITNHQLTTAILFLLFYPYHNFLTPNFRSFYISFFLIIYPSSSSLFIFSVKFIHSFGSVNVL